MDEGYNENGFSVRISNGLIGEIVARLNVRQERKLSKTIAKEIDEQLEKDLDKFASSKSVQDEIERELHEMVLMNESLEKLKAKEHIPQINPMQCIDSRNALVHCMKNQSQSIIDVLQCSSQIDAFTKCASSVSSPVS
eukprot:CAMPEP_0182445460 /NCGR_PEP_ID=MMETSP1172-20130603/3575_1 /TAXON_ID=708627 /ORGANISM="Timspurckia oligopyrenoides, Strain CCMP3278" /LENGTH=137 /DNA_ID=CAMNT_0024641233 /DNA_START=116 /DNA_END=529 /DNA_ORIENTATION=-